MKNTCKRTIHVFVKYLVYSKCSERMAQANSTAADHMAQNMVFDQGLDC